MYRSTDRSFKHHIVVWLVALSLVAALSLLAADVGSAAGSSGTVGKAAKHHSKHHVKPKPKHPALAGVMFGGVTAAHGVVVIQISPNGREVVEATMDVPCMFSLPQPGPGLVPNFYMHLPISATGAFHEKTERTEGVVEGTATITGQVSGQFNRAMTSVTGTWNLAVTVHNAFGAVVLQFDSGSVSFTAIQ
jgi:hypothetical protein